MARKALDELVENRDDIHLEEIEILRNPGRALREGVKFIPTLKCGEDQVSGIFLSRHAIRTFIEKMEQK